MKDNFFLPAIIFVVSIGLIAAYGFAVQTGYAYSRLIDTDYSEVYLGLLVNRGGAANGLLVPNGNVGIGVTPNGNSKLQIASSGITGIRVNTSGATSDTVSGALGVVSGGDAGWGVTGYSSNSNGSGVWGYGNGGNVGVKGSTSFTESGNGTGVYGVSGVGIGVAGQSNGLLADNTSYDFYGYGPKSYFSGNVGIGTLNPLSKLSVGGDGALGYAGYFNGEVLVNGTVYGNSVYGTSVRADSMQVTGTVTSEGTYQYNSKFTSQPYNISSERYVFELLPSMDGTAASLDTPIVDRLCRDLDGCELTIAFVNPDIDSAWSRVFKIFLSGNGNMNWGVSQYDNGGNTDGVDNNSIVNEVGVWDCFFGDFDTSTNNNNGRTDSGVGFGVLNASGVWWSTSCRFIIQD